MNVWLVVFRADPDAENNGVEDEMIVVAYRRLDRAMRECRKHLNDMFEDAVLENDQIDWAETPDSTAKVPKYFGRPKADVDGWFELFQAEVV